MWYLKGSSNNLIYLKTNKSVTFGRKKSNIVLEDDQSISRLHASIIVKVKEEVKENECTSVCILKDEDSKYGTYILRDDQVIEVTKEGCELKHEDKIKFGCQNHIFSIIYHPMITVVSTLTENDKLKLQDIMKKIDGIISTDWVNNCTHLTVSRATLTEKMAWALASATPIVVVDYWEAVRNAIDNSKEIPTLTDFLPPISEVFINKDKTLLCPNVARKTLFKNIISVHFSTKQYKIYGKMIFMTGGKPLLFSRRPLTNKQLCAPNVIVLQQTNSDATQLTECPIPEYDSICNLLQERKRRLIPETEIPIAILNCSIEKYCNPEFNFVQFLKRSEQTHNTSKVIALDTQDVPHSSSLPKITSDIRIKSNISIEKTIEKKRVYIPETLDYSSASFPVTDITNSVHSTKTEYDVLERNYTTFDSDTQKSNCKKNTDLEKRTPHNNVNNEHYHRNNYDNHNDNDSDDDDNDNDIIFVGKVDDSIKKSQEKYGDYIPETNESYMEESFKSNIHTVTNLDKKSSPKAFIPQLQQSSENKCSIKKTTPTDVGFEVQEKHDLVEPENYESIKNQSEESDGNEEIILDQDNNEHYISTKKICLEDSRMNNTTKFADIIETHLKIVESNKEPKMRDPLLREAPGYKTFQKVYKVPPRPKLILKDMYE